MTILAPAPLSEAHDLSGFDCGVDSLNDWLKRRARANHASGASRVYVSASGGRIAGFYALASGAVAAQEAPGKFRRNMPDPIPVVVLGRLAVDRTFARQGLGRALVKDAALRMMQAAEAVGVRGMLVHALSQEAQGFYRAVGFDPSPLDAMTLMITLADLRKAMGM